jgi:type IV secretory pathway VirB3-like protein
MVAWYLCVRPAMIAAIPTELIWLAVIVAMVMAGFVASAPE